MIRLLSSVIFLFCFWTSSESQLQVEYSAQAEEEFSRGLSLFTKAEYVAAAAVFEKIALRFARNQRTTAAYVMKAKAELYGGNLAQAEMTLDGFLGATPASTYVADAHYTRGLIFLKTGEYEKACTSFISALRTSESSAPVLKESIRLVLDETIDQHLSLQAVQQMVDGAKQSIEEEYLLIKQSEKQLDGGNRPAANAALDIVRRKFPQPSFSEKIAALERKVLQPVRLKLGVFLPVMHGDDQNTLREREVGVGLLEGIQTAVQEFEGNLDVTLESRLAKADAGSMIRELADDGSVIAIVGPAFSAAAQVAANVASERRIPIITPTANASGIAATSEFMFQANPDLETRAKAMAQHAVKNLKLRRLAILGATGPSSQALAEAFTKEVQRLGSEVVATEWYPQGTTDLLKQLTNMRRKGNAAAGEPYVVFNEAITKSELANLHRLGISLKVLDELKARRSVVNMTEFLGEDAKSKLSRFGIPFSSGDPRIDSVQRIVTAIEGIYCPISSASEISIITSQLAFYGIHARLLGSGEWNNATELNANKRYCRGVVFESDYYIDTKSMAYATFAERFMRQHKKTPSRYGVIGYDTAKLLLTLIRQGAATREQMREALSGVAETESLHARFTFKAGRVNSQLHILQFTQDGINRLSEISVE